MQKLISIIRCLLIDLMNRGAIPCPSASAADGGGIDFRRSDWSKCLSCADVRCIRGGEWLKLHFAVYLSP